MAPFLKITSNGHMIKCWLLGGTHFSNIISRALHKVETFFILFLCSSILMKTEWLTSQFMKQISWYIGSSVHLTIVPSFPLGILKNTTSYLLKKKITLSQDGFLFHGSDCGKRNTETEIRGPTMSLICPVTWGNKQFHLSYPRSL